jgi:hypothetical protein
LCFGGSFDVPLEHYQHSSLHDPDDRDEQPRGDVAFNPSRAERFIPTDHQASAFAGQLLEEEAPQSFGVGGGPWLFGVELAAAQIAEPMQT